ncbi:MAG: alkaline phytoceramidase, partial [Planctomycetota bacterium]
WTEQQGAGDLRLYGLVQFLPMLLIVIILGIYPPRFTHTSYIVAMLGMYAAAKLLEALDPALYRAGGLMSGHAIKHVVAAIAPYIFYLAMKRRRHVLPDA